MAPYYPVVVCRSDGLYDYTLNGLKVPNQPKPKDLVPTPNAQGQVAVYQKLSVDDPKSLQWRRKLGAMLLELLGGPEHSGMFDISLSGMRHRNHTTGLN